MIGMLIWKEPGKREKAVAVKERSILRVRFWCAEVLRGPKTPEAVLRRRVAAAGKRLRKQGVTRVVLPEEFAYGPQLEKWDLHPVSTLGLRRAIAADWVRWFLAEQGTPAAGARVAVSAEQLTLDLPRGGEDLCRQLRREYGVSLLLGPSKEQLEEAEALVLFAPREDCHSRRALALYDESQPLPPLLLPPALEEKLPKGCDRGQLLAALREQGTLRPGQIAVGGGISAK